MLTEIVAHRGYPKKAPENTLASFKKALAFSIDILEIDVHLTKDQQLVIIHDEAVDRTSNGHGFVKDKTLEELLKLDFGSWFSPKYNDEKIMCLSELLVLLKKINFSKKLLIEVKTDHFAYPGIEALLVKTIAQFDTHKYQIIYQSFNIATLLKIAKLDKSANLAALFFYPTWQILCLSKKNLITAIHPDNRWLINRIFWLKPSMIRPWKVNDPQKIRKILKCQLAGVITDEIELALDLRKEIQGG
ncbi:glycerophosphoryl diester phosphodiesterase [Weissella beninensis]|uniref:Glycerophosphodiester phosphodiesterase n=1 Tax=Periweissella beninensis TaxID=504936 RepID=A0ABT0VIC0_9LACO|nr:glycerophosphodiester phosphodiesterase family protein [Periweissella beninensis]MBM7544215.1 glycerophosphoryl diester phosphodiesterase [Periweissella beninensis]MCM2437578.1 glycerophosphodiester phosphodiesterase [Periweissella beninensis]